MTRPGARKCLVVACALAILAVGSSRTAFAQYFQYETTIDITNVVPLVPPANITGNGTDTVQLITASGTDIDFLGFASAPLIGPDNLDATGLGTDIVFGSIDVNVTGATPGQPLSFDFTYHLKITDFSLPSGGVNQGNATFQVTGTLTGTIGSGFKVNLNSIAVNPVAPQLIGGDLYGLSFNSQLFTPPGPIFPGSIGIHVQIVPEPSTWCLLTLGAFVLVTPAWRRLGRPRACGS